MKPKKLSAAILCGYKLVDGKQHFGDYANKDGSAVCVLGAVNLCLTGDPRKEYVGPLAADQDRFRKAWGDWAEDLNDEGMPWEHIYGMAVAAGL